MKYFILGIVLVVLLVVLILIRVLLKGSTIKALGLQDSINSGCTLQKIIQVGNDSIFKSLPKSSSNLFVICSKDEEVIMFIKNAGKNYALEHLIKFNRSNIVKTTSKKSLNMRIYTIELDTNDKFELWISNSKSNDFNRILKSTEE